MTFIQTVQGKIEPSLLGVTDCHNHLFITGGMPVKHYPDFLLNDFERIAADTTLFRSAGGNAIVEMSPIDWGRDAAAMVRLSRTTGIHIIAATGFHKLFYYPDYHWLFSYSEEDILNLVIAELIDGMDLNNYSGPLVRRSEARAGVIKVGTQTGTFSPTEKKLLRVAAQAHLLTGAPILTHSDEGALAVEQVDFLAQMGVPTSAIGISHLDRRLDTAYHIEIAERGALLEYDAMTRTGKNLDKATLELLLRMIQAGHVESILLGGDISRQGYWKSYGGGPGLDFIVEGFRQQLSAAGVSNVDLQKLYVENPRRFLTWREPAITSD